ncbi:MAG: hypothetical protein JXR39_11000, partial [Marinilabiliaceae bacterium]|nr:hypothetical protein [Marinilabiliaceae bacterium]
TCQEFQRTTAAIYQQGLDINRWGCWGGYFDPSEFVHFRKRIVIEGAEALLKISIQLFGRELVMGDVYIDTTVLEKNVTFPTDSKLYRKVIAQSLIIAKREGIWHKSIRISQLRCKLGLGLLIFKSSLTWP